ncbi:hypothetical protein [Streptomyces sp. NPDC054863]
MQRITRGTAGALAAAALFAGTVTACTHSPEAPRARAQARTQDQAQGQAQEQQTGPSAHSDAEIRSSRELQKRARDLLSDPDELPQGEFVASGSSANRRTASQSDLGETATSLVIEVSCVGQGTATFTVSSGRTRTTRRVDCTAPEDRIIQLDPAGRTVMVEATRGEHGRTAVAYLVRRSK